MSLQPVPIQNVPGVPDYTCTAFLPKSSDYCLLIPVINEGSRILTELGRAQKAGVDRLVDIVICDGGSTDGSMNPDTLELYGVNTLLVKTGPGKQGAQLRMGLHFALTFGYKGVLTIDGNNKDSIEDVPEFVAKLKEGYDLVQGSRFIPGGHAINTPKTRYAAVRLIHAPIISAAAHQWFTDTTNAYRAYSREYLTHPDVQPLRDVFMGYELLAYLSIRATQLGLRACEVPVTRAYPASGKTPTKISGFKGNSNLLQVLFAELKKAGQWVKQSPQDAAALLAPVWGLDVATVEQANSRRSYDVRAVQPGLLAEQQRIADAFLSEKLLPRRVNALDVALFKPGA